MSLFDDRERAFEAKWAHDEDTRLLLQAMANRRLAEWAARKAGLTGNKALKEIHRLTKLEYTANGPAAFRSEVIATSGCTEQEVSNKANEFLVQVEAETASEN
ncbi:ATPase inhibitor subunit zeta [Palleronia caenipelagi]|uniref:DUF1476 family protein n=1 Tax=Palleronia caenipelagi TaxID=2489174 RepID=A0A547PXY9_9RHOB|nr:ATPase inhibitor subunit zeta [Palleronia caenipelagi]TRD19002.1 DUF1476 family protein [Palleronia caenipelagi]